MYLHSYEKRIPFLLRVWLLLIILTTAGWLNQVSGQAANLDQGANGKSTAPDSPVDWINGNLNANQAHFLEGYSVPYRAILTGLTVNQNYTLVIALDVKNSGKHALDYITHYQRLEPHGIFLHGAETVSPLLNITGFPPAYFTSTDTEPIPVPSSAGSPVPGQPSASFNALPPAERVMTGYNADLLSVTYASHGSLTASQSETVIHITFKALKETAVLSWGGHIATETDWGSDPVTGETNSASAINGSPYHMRLKNWIINGQVVSIGNQDRSLKTDAVFIPPTCEVSGPQEACVSTASLAFTSTVDNATGLTYLWSIIGSNTAGAKIVNNTLANISVVPIGATFTPGTFNLRLIVTRNGLSDTCYAGSHVAPGLPVTIYQPVVDAGADVSITHLDIASLNATVAGGKSPYTFSWSPAIGLSDPNLHNPTFTPPSSGIFQFVVTVTDAAGCTDKDTVVITVTQHADPPCIIDGPDPVCPGSSNIYTGPPPADVSFFQWSVTGNGTITGDTDKGTVTILAGNTCGPYTIQLITATPDGKVKDTCTRTVQVQDNEKPVLHGTAPDAALACGKDVPAAPVITATDNCLANITVQSSSTTLDSTCINKYRIVRKWWAVDLCGNTSDTLTQVITVNDDVKPVISGEYEATVNVACVGDIPAPPGLTANDNCDGPLQPSYTEEGSGTACDSTIVRTWVFTDACGNSASATQTIHLKDAVAPTLVGTVQDANVTCSKDVPAPPVITANDNCPAEVKVNFTSTTSDSTCVNKFKIVRKWWAVDGCGNTSDVLTQTIIVNDDVKPVISGEYEATVNVACVGDIPAPQGLTANDNCDGPLQPSYTEEGSGTACDSTIVRTWVFTDACGNSASATQTIHLKDAVAPTLVGTVQDANVTCSKDVPAPPVITANDNCPAEVKVEFTSTTSDSTCVNKFKIVRKWWAVDGCGNTSDVLTQTIIVNDNVKPVIEASYEDKIEVKCVGDIPTPPAVNAFDNCDGALQPAYSEEGSGTACDSTILRKWVFTDACGNSVTATQTIHLQDLVPPTLNGTAENVNVTCAKDIPAPPVITASDNCPADVKINFTEDVLDSTCVNKFRLQRVWWAEDGCGNTSDRLIQIITVNDDVKPVISGTYEEAVNVACVGDIPAPPSLTATDNCEGVLQPDYSEEGSGTACDSTIVRTWVFTDGCGNSATATQTIHLQDLIRPTLNGTATDATVVCSKDVPAPPEITGSDNCGTPKVYSSETKTDVVCVNRFVLLRKWWAKDKCGNTSDTLYQKVTVYDNVAPEVSNKPADKTLPCGSQPSFNAPSFNDNCGGNVTVVVADRQEGTSCPVTYVRRWTATDACGNSVWVEQRVKVLCCASYCSYTQGYYGNVNGKACLPGGGTTTAKAIMLGAVDAQPGDSVLFGLKATGKFFTLFLADVSNDNIFKMLPGGGTPAALKGYATFSKPATWPLVPLSAAASTYGKIKNVLLSQTMTLFFNFRVTPALSGLPIEGTLLMTSKLTACGSTVPVAKVDSFELPKSVVNYLTSIGQANVGGLYNLANKYLGGQTVTGVTASDVNAAVDAINRGFDKCAVLIGWSNNKLSTIQQVMAAGEDNNKLKSNETETNTLRVETFPNPYRDVVTFRFTAPETGTLQLLIYNLGGQQVDVLNKGTVQKGSVQQIRYAVPDAHRSTLIYKLSVGRAEATGKLIYIKH